MEANRLRPKTLAEERTGNTDRNKGLKVPMLFRGRPPRDVAYWTSQGRMYHGKAENILSRSEFRRFSGRFQLVFTSPPFPLNTKKRYGNLRGEEYLEWLASFGSKLRDLLTEDGSMVIEIGNAWESGRPVMSSLPVRALLEIQERNDLYLCQEFIWSNPAKLPSPAQWVTVERIRVKDSFTRLWWMSPVTKPKANNRHVLQPYSKSMRKLLRSGKYNAGERPSEHVLGETSFLKDRGGAIPGSVISCANTSSVNNYMKYCRRHELRPHPARMPCQLAEFFINFLTDPGDLVMDPFAGSNTTGASAEHLGRHWLSIEPEEQYVAGSIGRFEEGLVRTRKEIT